MKITRTLLESIPILLLVTCISIFAGYLLNSTLSLGEIVGVLTVTPALLSTGGNIGTSFGSRITTSLHSGLIEPHFKRIRLVYVNFIAMLTAGIIIAVIIGFLGYFLSILINPIQNFTLTSYLILTIGAGIIDYSVVLFISLFTAFLSFRRGLDPDNLVAPLVTTIADLIGISTIFLILNLLV